MEVKDLVIKERKAHLDSIKRNHTFKLLSKTNRNEIYRIDDTTILKFYTKRTRWTQEILALKKLNFNNLIVPQLIKYGTNDNTLFWIEQTSVPGKPISELINIFEHPDLIYKIGQLHAMYHQENEIKNMDKWSNLDLNNTYSLFPNRIVQLNRIRMEKLKNSDYFPKDLISTVKSSLYNYEDKIFNYNDLVLCHNDFSHRNLLATEKDNGITITSLIDFELCYPADAVSDLSRFMLDLISNNKDELSKKYISGYINIYKLDNFEEKLFYYILSLSIEVMTWANIGAHDYYKTVYKTLNGLISDPEYYINLFKM